MESEGKITLLQSSYSDVVPTTSSSERPSSSHHAATSSTSSSITSGITVTHSYPSISNIPSEKNLPNSNYETKLTSRDSDSEDEKSRRDSFADEGLTPRDSADVTSLLSAAEVTATLSSDARRVNSDYSLLSDTSSTYDDNRPTITDGEELNLTDISVAPSETSETTTTLESENDYGEIVSSSSERNSFRDSNEESYVVSEDYPNPQGERFPNALSDVTNILLEGGYDSNAEPVNDNLRYYSTILEESEEDDSIARSSLEALGNKSDMGQHYSSSSGGGGEESSSKKKKKHDEPCHESQNSSRVSSEGWRMSQVSTNTNVSSSTGADSEDTLAQNMSELSSINSHLSCIGETNQDFKSLERQQVKYCIENSKGTKEDSDATPVATPIATRRENAIIKNAINELENIELAAQNLLQQRQASPEILERQLIKENKIKNHAKKSEKLESNDASVNQNNTITNIYKQSTKDNNEINVVNTETKEAVKPPIVLTSIVNTETKEVDKPPIVPTASPKPEIRRKKLSKSKEPKPYISRESYNEELVLKEIEALRASYNETDLNDFLDKLESSGVKDSLDDDIYEQLVADIKADVERSKQSSTESLHSLNSNLLKTSSTRKSQESLSSLSKYKYSAGKKFERLKERILELVNKRKKTKNPSKSKLTGNKKEKELNNKDTDVDGSSRPITPSSRSNTPQIIELRPITPETHDFKRSRSTTPETRNRRSPTPESSKVDERRGFKISQLFKKASPIFMRKKTSKELKNRKSDVTTSESDNEMDYSEALFNESKGTTTPKENQGSLSNLKGSNKSSPNSSSHELKKEVRFNLKLEEVPNNQTKIVIKNCEPQNDQQIVHEITEKQQTGKQNIEAPQKKPIIPSTVLEVIKANEMKYEANARAETLLPKLPERVRPPRRKKKNLIPVPIQNANWESCESTSQKSSDDSTNTTPKNSSIFDSTPISSEVKHEKISSQNQENIINKEINTSINDYPILKEEYKTKDNLKNDADKQAEVNETDKEMKIPSVEVHPVRKEKEIKSLVIKDNQSTIKDEISELEKKLLKQLTDELEESEAKLTSEKLNSPFVKESTPSFPEVDENATSFYDNVNPYHEVMSQLAEEEEVENEKKDDDDKAEIEEKDEEIIPNKVQDKIKLFESGNQVHVSDNKDVDFVEINKDVINKEERDNNEIIRGKDYKNNAVRSLESGNFSQESDTKDSDVSKNSEEVIKINEISNIDTAKVKNNRSNAVRSLESGNYSQESDTKDSDVSKISEEVKKISEISNIDTVKAKNYKSNAVRSLGDSPNIEESVYVKNGNESRQAARKSPENEEKAFNLDELSSITEEITRITDDMEKEMNLAKTTMGVSSAQESSTPKVPTPQVEKDHEKVNHKPNAYSYHNHSNSANKSTRKYESAPQTDTEYDETDFETESELEEASSSQKPQMHSKHFFGPSVLHMKNGTVKSSTKKPPAVPPRHFQQKMPQKVVAELKSVLSDSEEFHLKKPILPPRWDSVLTYNNGRSESSVTGAETSILSPSFKYSNIHSNTCETPVSAADPHSKQPLSSSPSSTNLTTPSNLIATSVLKSTKPNRNEKIDRRRSCSVSTENLAPIPEEANSIYEDISGGRVTAGFKTSFLTGGRNEKKENQADHQKASIFRVRANVYPSFASLPKIPRGKPPVPRPLTKQTLNSQSFFEDGYQSDPGTQKSSYNKIMNNEETGYATDSEILMYPKNTLKVIDANRNKFESIQNRTAIKANDKNNADRKANLDFPPPRPPPPSQVDLYGNALKENRDTKTFNKQTLLPGLKDDKNKVECNLKDNYSALFKQVTADQKCVDRPYLIDYSLPLSRETQKQRNVYPVIKKTSVEAPPQSISLSARKAFEEHPNEGKKTSLSKVGSAPGKEVSYFERRQRPLTWCTESDFQSSLSQYDTNNKMKSPYNMNDKSPNSRNERFDNEYSESRPTSQLSHCSSQRLQAQGLGEWLFLARLDHTNHLLSQLNSTMQLQPDRSPGVNSDQQNGNTDVIFDSSKSPRRKLPPPPPPRPRTPIDERDPEQVLAERRYQSYFEGGPKPKLPPDQESNKLSSFQQSQAEKRYNNYFIGPPQANPENLNFPPPDLENDDEVQAARRRYLTYFQKGPPRPRSCIEPEKFLESDQNTLEAQKRYQSYFQPSIPRSRSTVSRERTPDPDHEQKVAEQRYQSYFSSGPPRPHSNIEKSRTPEPDEEQIEAEKRYIKYFEGFPKAKHSKSDEKKPPAVDSEMIAAEERFLKYFQPTPCGPPRKRILNPPPSKEMDLQKKQLFAEFQKAIESRSCRKEMKIVRVSKPKKEVERETTPPTLRDKVVEEFLQKVQDRKVEKDLHFGDTDDEDEDITRAIPLTTATEEPIIQGGGSVDKRISTDLQLFVGEEEVWSPGGVSTEEKEGPTRIETSDLPSFKDVPTVWTPARAGSASPSLGRKEYYKIKFEGSTLPRKASQENMNAPRPEESFAWRDRDTEKRKASSFLNSTTLPRVQSPTVTLLQKRREGEIPGQRPDYIQPEESFYKPGDKLYTIKREYESEDEETGSRKFAVLGPKKFEGVGPTTRDGVPIALKSGVKSEHQGEWYKRMFDSLHKVKDARYGGYMSEPDGYDSDIGSSRYVSLDRRNNKFDIDVSENNPRNTKRKYVHQPGRIENYVPGFSSLSEKELRDNPEADVKLEFKTRDSSGSTNHRHGSSRMQMGHALKESGYESDSTLVFRKREDQRRRFLDPHSSSVVYRQVQQGGEIPLSGLQKPAPPKPKDSPYKYNSSEVNIHYRTPVRFEQKETLSEEELARRQEEHMKKVYEQERRKKYLAELEDIERRRHTDNFTPLQKSPIPLNRYDDETFGGMVGAKTPEPRQVARALFNFSAQNKRELSFTKGDIVTIRRSIDRNWYEGEMKGLVGIFPCNYVEVVPFDSLKTLGRKPTDGQARTRFNFQAQTAMEMSLTKGEMVVLTRRVDENWFEGRVGNRRGIFPVTYVDVMVEPGGDRPMSPSRDPIPRPALPAAHLLYNGTSGVSSPYSTMGRSGSQSESKSFTQLTVNTQQDPIPYRALYNYKPQNEDELELIEGDIVLVMEKCDDGWFVGTSKRTGLFGTFPGNYVERS